MKKDSTPVELNPKKKIDSGYGRVARPAGLGERIGAYIIDSAMMLLIWTVLLGFVIYDNISFLLELGEMSPELVDTYFEENTGIVLTFLVQLFVAGGAAIIATWAYSVIPAITRWQGTLGKRILGLAMVRSSDGGPVGLWRATGRFLAFGAIFWILAGIFAFFNVALPGLGTLLYIGATPAIFLGVALTRESRQSLHDLVAGTRVIRDPRRKI